MQIIILYKFKTINKYTNQSIYTICIYIYIQYFQTYMNYMICHVTWSKAFTSPVLKKLVHINDYLDLLDLSWWKEGIQKSSTLPCQHQDLGPWRFLLTQIAIFCGGGCLDLDSLKSAASKLVSAKFLTSSTALLKGEKCSSAILPRKRSQGQLDCLSALELVQSRSVLQSVWPSGR